MNDERFVSFNSMPTVLSKYQKAATPDFSKTSTKDTLDEFFGCSTKN